MTPNMKRVLASLDRDIGTWMKAYGIPGMCISVTDRKGTLRSSEYGLSDLAAKKRVRKDTMFQIGSISKSFTSICALQLAEEGLLDLRRPVRDYIPWFEVRSKHGPITLHHLMTHTAGIVIGTESLIRAVPEVYALRDTDTSAPPGEHFHYSNVGYKAVGLALENVTGKSVADLVRERVVEPLGMKSTTTTIINDVREKLAVGYAELKDDRPRPLRNGLAPATWNESDTGDGSICSTADDMARYVRLLLNRGKGPKGRVLSEDSFALMTSRHIATEDGEHYGYGLGSVDVDGHVHIQHTGGMVGYHSSMVMDMDLGIGVFASVNGPGEPSTATSFVLASLRAAVEGKKAPSVVPRLPEPYLIKNSKDYAGEFVCGDRTLRFTASRDALHLVKGRKKKVRMDLRGPDEFFADDPAHDRFLFRFIKSGETVTEVVHGPDGFRRPGTSASSEGLRPREWEAFVGHYRSYNPWLSNFRVVPREAGLAVIYPWGVEEPLTHLGGNRFRAGKDPLCPETIAFELVIHGEAQVARISWGVYTRTFTP